jgi:hypothetical protein
MFNRNLNLRIDDSTDAILKVLVDDLRFSKAMLVRRSLRILQDLNEIKKRYGEIWINTGNGERILILLS